MKYIGIIAATIFIMITFSQTLKSQNKMPELMNKVNVWDTYVTKKNGQVMHFDIIAPAEIKDTLVIYGFGIEYLKSKGQEGQALNSKHCRLCHMENLRPAWEKEIDEKGYFIIEMEGCN